MCVYVCANMQIHHAQFVLVVCVCVCGFRTDQPSLADGEKLINLLSAVISFPQIFVCRWNPVKFYLLLLKMPIGIPMHWSCLYRHFWERLFHSTLPYILTLKVFLPTLSRCSMIHRCRSCDADISFGLHSHYPLISALCPVWFSAVLHLFWDEWLTRAASE